MKLPRVRKAPFLLTIVLAFFLVQLAQAGDAGIWSEAHSSLDDKELGHVRQLVRMANQPLGQGKDRDPAESGLEYDTSSSFQLVFLVYTLGLAHYHYTPAYREIYQQAMDRVIQKMLGKGNSEYGEQARLKVLGGAGNEPFQRESVMFSGHLLAAAGYYAMLFREMKYTEPGSMIFDYKTVFTELGDRDGFEYNFSSLAKAANDQYLASPMGFVCEPNAIFMFCNGYPFYGFRFHDHVLGSHFLDSATDNFRKAWEKKGGFLNKDGHFVETYLMAQDFIWVQPSAYFDAWAGTWMNAWNHDFVKSLYPGHARHWVKWLPDGTAYIEPRPETNWSLGPSSDFGHFAVYASELGDSKTVEALLAYADKHMNPTWDQGAYYYPRCDDLKNQAGLPVLMTPLAGNALLALARINVPNGIHATFNDPFDEKHFEEPYIDSVDYPRLLVRQAVYDNDKHTLILGFTPGQAGGKTTFRVNRLDAARDWEIIKNKTTIGWLRRGRVQVESGTNVELKMEDKDTLRITLELKNDTTYIVRSDH